MTDRDSPSQVAEFIGGEITQLSAGCHFSAALTGGGQVYIWGSNTDGQLGLVDTHDNVLTPTLLTFSEEISQLSCGYYHTAFVTVDGGLFTCGESENGKLGLPNSVTNVNVPQRVSLGEPVKMVVCGGNHTIAVTAEGQALGFGNNFSGQLGLGPEVTQSILPSRIDTFKNQTVLEVSCGESHSAFITSKGHLYMCGEGRHGKLCKGEQESTNQHTPDRVMKFKDYTVHKVACGGCHTMVLATQGPVEGEDIDNELDGLSQLNDTDSGDEDSLMAALSGSNKSSLPPIQHIPVPTPTHNGVETEALQEEAQDLKVSQASLDLKSELSVNVESLDDVEQTSTKSKTPETEIQENGTEEQEEKENSETEDIEEIEDKPEDLIEVEQREEENDNEDVTVESEEKKGNRVARFFKNLRRKKPTSAPAGADGGLDQLETPLKRGRAASEGNVCNDDKEERVTSATSTASKSGHVRKSKACIIL